MTKAGEGSKVTAKKGGKLSARKEPIKDLEVKGDAKVKGGGTTGCLMTFKSTGRSSC